MDNDSKWRKYIEEWKRSELSESEWCKSIGFKPGRLLYWRKQLGYTEQPSILVISIDNDRIEITENTNLEFLQEVLRVYFRYYNNELFKLTI